jgi:hypothetical protein
MVNKLVTEKLADNALNARLPRHFADGRSGDRARRWGFRGDLQGGTKGRRNAMRPSFPLLEPPLGVWGVFGGTKTPKHQLKKETRNPNKTGKNLRSSLF